ncbi:hypothetical protein [Microbacterium flavum]|uniref:hypothetical protein n=1 Tax=Microbacterium flavum TaxID=415216 RepID=UPI0024AE09C1|nr:hypothetical protein [Microbacterium flavum]
MRSSADGFDRAIAEAVRRITDATAEVPTGIVPIILIDGRSGSGKTTLAGAVRAAWPGEMSVVALDDIYPGWGGLAEGAATARTAVLEPIAAGRDAHWRRWDWASGEPGTPMTTPAGTPLIIEGCGALTAESAALAPIRVWIESPAQERRRRALARDGETFRPHWEMWAAQEVRHIAADDPIAHATIHVEVP